MSKESKAKADQVGESFSVREIRSLLDLCDKHEVSEFKLERGDDKLWLKRGTATEENAAPNSQSPQIHINSLQPSSAPAAVAAAPVTIAPAAAPAAPAARAAAVSVEPAPQAAPVEVSPTPQNNTVPEPAVAPTDAVALEPAQVLKEVSSPMVGTFYRRPAVDADPYVEVGDSVKKGDVLCIVEAMKLMNEIESDVTGTIVEVCLDDGQMVEYGEVLFRIEPA